MARLESKARGEIPSIIRGLLVVLPVLVLSSYLAYLQHSTLPKPIEEQYHPLTSHPQLSERAILAHAKHLSEGIGYRTVGTREHALGDAWMVEQVEDVKRRCEEMVKKSGGKRKLECEVWRQEGSGKHRFDIMGKRLYKSYSSLSNIILRISSGTPQSKEHAVLVNAHVDSTLPSPGAADDALPVGVMLECARVLVESEEWEPRWAIVFLFNNAEESLQDGSHLYSTQHETASTVRAVINLEAAGTTGRELLFQATSEEMIQAYSQVPRPFGTIFANDIFSSGILLSDTDFRQFELYLNVTGLDMAVVGNSYLYHMRKDLVENIGPGVAQHMAENTLSLLTHLSTSPHSPIPSLLSAGYTKPSTTFFSHIGMFIVYSFERARVMYAALVLGVVGLIAVTSIGPGRSLSGGKKGSGEKSADGGETKSKTLLKAAGTAVLSALGAVVSANAAAVIMDWGLGKGMSWFRNEYFGVVLYGPVAVFGSLLPLAILPPTHERALLLATIALQSLIALNVQVVFNAGSAALLFVSALPMFGAVCVEEVVTRLSVGKEAGGKDGRVPLWVYALGMASPFMTGTLMMLGVIEFFAPLTGRMGASIPADSIIATIVSAIGTMSLPLLPAFMSRFGRRTLRRSIAVMGVVSAVLMAIFARMEVYDSMHQRRVFIVHYEDIHTHVHSLHMAASDGAPGFEDLVHGVAGQFGTGDVVVLKMTEYVTELDPLYPFSALLAPYKLALPEKMSTPFEGNFGVTAVEDEIDVENGTRRLVLRVDHPGVIWTVIAFDAHVLAWSLDDNPPDEHTRHHIKEASFYGVDTYDVSLLIKLHSAPSPPTPPASDMPGNLPARPTRLRVDFTGIREQAMWPGKKAEKEKGGDAMVLFERLDEWLEGTMRGTVDGTMLGVVGGSVLV